MLIKPHSNVTHQCSSQLPLHAAGSRPLSSPSSGGSVPFLAFSSEASTWVGAEIPLLMFLFFTLVYLDGVCVYSGAMRAVKTGPYSAALSTGESVSWLGVRWPEDEADLTGALQGAGNGQSQWD